ncbi:MAG: hypothetical protein ACI8Z9_001560, partial [Paraglaciecola sp.]
SLFTATKIHRFKATHVFYHSSPISSNPHNGRHQEFTHTSNDALQEIVVGDVQQRFLGFASIFNFITKSICRA